MSIPSHHPENNIIQVSSILDGREFTANDREFTESLSASQHLNIYSSVICLYPTPKPSYMSAGLSLPIKYCYSNFLLRSNLFNFIFPITFISLYLRRRFDHLLFFKGFTLHRHEKNI